MKSQVAKLFGMGIALVLLISVTGFAQPPLKATIPFDFVVQNQTLPAGEYHVGPTRFPDPSILWIKKLDGSAIANVITIGRRSTQQSNRMCLIFTQVHGKYFLYQVWNGTEEIGRQLIPSRIEKELVNAAKTQAKGAGLSSEVIVVASK